MSNLNYTYPTSFHDSKAYIFHDMHLNKANPIKIMMIDDSERDVNLVRDLLTVEARHEFVFSGYTSISKLFLDLKIIQLPDIIILDLIMPGLHGNLVLMQLKELINVKQIPVIIHSSMHNYQNIIKASELEAHAFFQKTLDIEQFENYILDSI